MFERKVDISVAQNKHYWLLSLLKKSLEHKKFIEKLEQNLALMFGSFWNNMSIVNLGPFRVHRYYFLETSCCFFRVHIFLTLNFLRNFSISFNSAFSHIFFLTKVMNQRRRKQTSQFESIPFHLKFLNSFHYPPKLFCQSTQ